MATHLLHCYICPKRPNFSDTSHLLTHISSKGHLSHLHKLQVRSHQEASAGQQIAFYNQWFTEHDVANMLSERMQQKEMKQARKQADNNRRCTAARQRHQANLDPNLLPTDHQFKLESPGCSAYAPSTNHISGYPYLDVASCQLAGQASSFATQPASIETSWSYINPSPVLSVNSSPGGVGGTTPEAAKLKGVIWPGMDIFDSANQETQRKRNQKKDISVLEKMQSMSELVEPTETVRSPGGTVKKRRHMDDLENDSPVEGESPLLKQSSRRHRRPLSTISVSLKGPVRHKPKPAPKLTRVLTTPTRRMPSVSKYRYSRRGQQPEKSIHSGQDSVPADNAQTKTRGFAVFNDGSNTPTSRLPSNVLSNPFLRTGHEGRHITKPLTFPLTPWLQPTQRSDQYTDPFKPYRPVHFLPGSYPDNVDDKENINPLLWSKGLSTAVSSPVDQCFDTFDGFDDDLGALTEVYAFTKNPLSTLR